MYVIMTTSSASGGFAPRVHLGFAYGPHWGTEIPQAPKICSPPEIIPGYATAATTTTTTTLHADTDNTEHRNDDSRAKYCFAVGWCAQTTTVSENLGGITKFGQHSWFRCENWRETAATSKQDGHESSDSVDTCDNIQRHAHSTTSQHTPAARFTKYLTIYHTIIVSLS